MKPRIHLITCFHTIQDMDRFSHCAFTAKSFKFSKMMQPLGYEIIEYSNGESKSEAHQKVQMLTETELFTMTGQLGKTDFHGNTAQMGTPWWTEFDRRLKDTLRKNVRKGDIIGHQFGRAHMDLVRMFPEQISVELGIGYPDEEFGAYRIFETHAWKHYHQGRHLYYDETGRVCMRDNNPIVGRSGSDYEFVCPNYFDVDDWPVSTSPGGYVLFFGRICQIKGMEIVRAIAEAGIKVKVAGQGDMKPWAHPNLEYLGPVSGKARGPLLAGAKIMLCPSRFVEPFCGSAVESMMAGTPVAGSSFGAFVETIEHGKTGWRCHTLGDWMAAIEKAPTLDRQYIADRARRLYSLEAVGPMYDRVFTQLNDLWDKGWYEKRPIFV